MTLTQTREPARPRRTAQSAGSRTTTRRRRWDFLVHVSLSAIAALITAVTTLGSVGDATCFIAALSLYPLIAPAHPRPRRQNTDETAARNQGGEPPYEPWWWRR